MRTGAGQKGIVHDQPWSAAEAYAKWLLFYPDIMVSSSATPEVIAARRQQRLHEIIAFARRHSRFYRDKYSAVKSARPALTSLPPVSRAELMDGFDDWVTDPAVTRRGAEHFMSGEWRIGRAFLGRYTLWSSSGTTGEPGIFVHDISALAVYDALSAVRFKGMNAQHFISGSRSEVKLALIAAQGHFAGVATWQRLRQTYPQIARRTKIFSINAPLEELVQALNRFNPTFIASYPTVFQMLAGEKTAGRLEVTPQGLWSGGECLSAAARAAATAFGCRIVDEYGASEFMNLAFECAQGKLHLNSDWAWLEPVDEKMRPVPPGSASATVLLTNLANRVQPFIRYDLGDSVTMSSKPCRCGSPFPVVQVQGRQDEILTLKNSQGRDIPLLPLAISTALEEDAGVHHFQVIQIAPATLAVRMPGGGRHDGVDGRVRKALKAFLTHQGLPNARVRIDDVEPIADKVSGKFRRVWMADQQKDRL